MASATVSTPADSLEGKVLTSGWLVGKRVTRAAGGTGSTFGICYLATKGEAVAFVKAVDFRRAFAEPDLVQAVMSLAREMAWEKEILELCRAHGLSRIVKLVEHEYFLAEEDSQDPTKRVSCLIMEVGRGDLRGELGSDRHHTFSWMLHVVRDICLAVDQLHRKGVAHLDVKPSNVIFVPNGEVVESKLGDLARSVRKGAAGPFDDNIWPGDRGYMPPEKWYGFRSSQWNNEREAADLFLVGSLLIFLITGIPMSTLLYNELPDNYRPGLYRGDYNKAVIDVLLLAQSKVLAVHVAPYLPAQCRDELLEVLVQMTHPDPAIRGDRHARRSGVVGVDRFHQRFLRIAKRLEIEERVQAAR